MTQSELKNAINKCPLHIDKKKGIPQKLRNANGFLAEAVGFEPTEPVRVQLISSQSRYDHFDTLPYLSSTSGLRYPSEKGEN